MVLPSSYLQAMILMICGVLLMGSWAATFKSTRKWRFELYYLDFALGVGIAAVAYGVTLGYMGFDGFSLLDDIRHAGRRDIMLAMLAGVVFNLGNMLMLAGISVAGMALAYPMGFGLAMFLGITVPEFIENRANRGLLLGGIFFLLGAMVAAAFSYSGVLSERWEAMPKDPKKRPPPEPSAVKGVMLSLVGGLLMAGTFPLQRMSQAREIGLGPYSMMLLFAIGVVASTAVYDLFFMNLPVEGEPLEIFDYFQGKAGDHFKGFLGGILLITGLLATQVVTASAADLHLGRVGGNILIGAIPLVGATWGVLKWRELGSVAKRRGGLLVLLFLAVSAALLIAAPYMR